MSVGLIRVMLAMAHVKIDIEGLRFSMEFYLRMYDTIRRFPMDQFAYLCQTSMHVRGSPRTCLSQRLS